jgi:hypothetical protein
MINLLIYFCCIGVGFIIGLLIRPVNITPSTDGFVLSKEINLAELLSVLVPILIGLLVALFFQRPNDRRLRIREVLINRIHQVDQHLVDTLEAARSNSITYQQAASVTKKCTSEVEAIFSRLAHYRLIGTGGSTLREIQVALHSLRNPLTYTTPVNQDTARQIAQPLTVSMGICSYSQSRFAEIEMRIAEARSLLLELELDVNEAN